MKCKKCYQIFTLKIDIKEHIITVYDLVIEICIMGTQEEWRLKTHEMKYNENAVGIVTFEKKIHSKFNVKFVNISSKSI